MRALLDTHTFLWFIEDGTNDVLVSLASIWEMAIKASLGKLSLNDSFDRYISQ